MNTLIITGNTGSDAEVRSAGGSPVCSFSVAEKQGFGNDARTVWYRVDMWGSRGEKLAPHIKKGMKVAVAGELTMDEYQGKPQYRLRADRIDFMSPRQEGGGGGAPSRQPAYADDDMDDSVPFVTADPALEWRVR
jgi:single-strand DNA-binding protein